MGDRRRILALTLIQPWAELIVRGPKRVENRTWRPHPLKTGDYLAIHAGAFLYRKVCDEWFGAIQTARAAGLLGTLPVLDGALALPQPERGERGRLYAARCNRYMEKAVPYSAVIGVAQLDAIETEAPAAGDPWWYGPLGWRLGNVTAIEPVPCRGSQGLWEMPDEVLATVRARWKAARPQPAVEVSNG